MGGNAHLLHLKHIGVSILLPSIRFIRDAHHAEVFICRPEGPAAGAKRLHSAEGREGERSETVVPEAAD